MFEHIAVQDMKSSMFQSSSSPIPSNKKKREEKVGCLEWWDFFERHLGVEAASSVVGERYEVDNEGAHDYA
jgi:hypothetical protein